MRSIAGSFVPVGKSHHSKLFIIHQPVADAVDVYKRFLAPSRFLPVARAATRRSLMVWGGNAFLPSERWRYVVFDVGQESLLAVEREK